MFGGWEGAKEELCFFITMCQTLLNHIKGGVMRVILLMILVPLTMDGNYSTLNQIGSKKVLFQSPSHLLMKGLCHQNDQTTLGVTIMTVMTMLSKCEQLISALSGHPSSI
jgi:hypothetical protein